MEGTPTAAAVASPFEIDNIHTHAYTARALKTEKRSWRSLDILHLEDRTLVESRGTDP